MQLYRKDKIMKNTTKKIFSILLTAALFFSVFGISQTSSAASKNTAAVKAYKSLLSKKTYKWGYSDEANKTANYSFACVDLNKDGIKELIVINDNASYADGYCKIFTYSNRKVKCITTCTGFDWYKKGRVLGMEDAHTGGYWGNYYRLSKSGKLIEKASYSGTDMKEYAKNVKHTDGSIYYTSYKIGKKEVSYKTYKKKLSRLLKGKKTTINYRKNTAANRKRVLKQGCAFEYGTTL